jgi:hypothetical protein
MTMKSGAFAATAALVSAAALQLTGCAKSDIAQIVPDKAADLISHQVQSKSGFTPTDVSCPAGIEAKVGAQFACTFSGPSGKYAIRMKVTKVDGGYVEYDMSWRLTEPVDTGTGTPPSTTDNPSATETPDDTDTPSTSSTPGDSDTPTGTGNPTDTDNPGTPDSPGPGSNGDTPSGIDAPSTGPVAAN